VHSNRHTLAVARSPQISAHDKFFYREEINIKGLKTQADSHLARLPRFPSA